MVDTIKTADAEEIKNLIDEMKKQIDYWKNEAKKAFDERDKVRQKFKCEPGIHGHSANGPGVMAESRCEDPMRAAFRIVPQNSEPAIAEEGDIYCNAKDHCLYFYNGTQWMRINYPYCYQQPYYIYGNGNSGGYYQPAPNINIPGGSHTTICSSSDSIGSNGAGGSNGIGGIIGIGGTATNVSVVDNISETDLDARK